MLMQYNSLQFIIVGIAVQVPDAFSRERYLWGCGVRVMPNIDPQGYRYDVFISYAHRDKKGSWVERLHEDLEVELGQILGRDARLFSDIEGLLPGEIWERKIFHELRHSVCMVAIHSPSYFNSDYCQKAWRVSTK